MSTTFHVDIVSAEQEIYSGTATMLFAPASEGEVGIAPRHSPLLTRLVPGEVRVVAAGEGGESSYFVSGGMLEVQPHAVTILADTVVRARDLDEAAAKEAEQRAQRALQDRKSGIDFAQAQAELAEVAARLQTIQRIRKRASGH